MFVEYVEHLPYLAVYIKLDVIVSCWDGPK